ncbi:4792_t:CDS:1, partial [Funneliformis mosseae]
IELNDDNDFFDYLEEADEIREYFQIINEDISTEENLNDD